MNDQEKREPEINQSTDGPHDSELDDHDLVVQHVPGQYSAAQEDAGEYVNEHAAQRQNRSEQTEPDSAVGQRGACPPLDLPPELESMVRRNVRAMNMFDSVFFQRCISNNVSGVSDILWPILKDPRLEILAMSIQDTVTERAFGSDGQVNLEVLLGTGETIDVVIRHGQGSAALIDSMQADEDDAKLQQRCTPDGLRSMYVVILCKDDPFGQGEPVYHIQKTIEETGGVYHDGIHTIYINGLYEGNNAIGRVMHDLRAVDPSDIRSPSLRERAEINKAFVLGGATTLMEVSAAVEWYRWFDACFEQSYYRSLAAQYRAELDDIMRRQIDAVRKETEDICAELGVAEQTIVQLRAELAQLHAQQEMSTS